MAIIIYNHNSPQQKDMLVYQPKQRHLAIEQATLNHPTMAGVFSFLSFGLRKRRGETLSETIATMAPPPIRFQSEEPGEAKEWWDQMRQQRGK